MKQIICLFILLAGVVAINAQNTAQGPTTVSQAEYVREIPALSSMGNIIAATGFEHVAPPKRRGQNTYIPGSGLPNGPDPLAAAQRNAETRQGRAPIVDFVAHQGTVLNDPTGAIGPNHYVYAFNSGFGILDRAGNVLLPEASLGTLFPGETLGDPVVVYDRYADRFIVMEFSNTPNGILIAVCQGPDPVNDGWFTYRFNTGTFPDYEKLSVWSDGYYITANKDQGSTQTSDVVFAVERDQMLVGDPNAQFLGFPLPQSENNGFYSPGGFNAIGTSLPPVGTPQPIVYMQDDAWTGVNQNDHLKIWDISVDWVNPNNSSISAPQLIFTNPFDSVFDNGSFQNLDEPGNGPDIDALQATMMYMTNYRRFGTHNSAVMNFVVDVSGNDTRAGIRWLELRQTADGQPWTIFQEGTYSQPNHSVFSGSISMDHLGNIGLGYTIVSSTIFTSLRYTGRLVSDPLGTMSVAETFIVDGDSQNNRSDGRYGDYAQLTVDPLDDRTFWHIGEYMKGPNNVRKSHVAAFIVGSLVPDDEDPSDPTNLVASNIGANTTDLDWTASTDNIGVTGYDIFQDGVLVATAGTNTFTVTGLTPLTNYDFYVIAKDAAGNTSGQSNTVSVTTIDGQPEYCASTSSNVNDEYIGRVQLNDIDNTSGAQFYSDFTNITGNLSEGEEYTITITPVWTGTIFDEGYSVWIDYNKNGDFSDPGEQVFTQAPTQDTPISGTFTVPSGISVNNTRMRVSLKYNAIPTECESFTWGEVEDYNINILSSGPTILHEGYFETGLDGWIDGGNDVVRRSDDRAYEGLWSMRLRDGTNPVTAAMTLEDIDVSPFNSINIDFFFNGRGMDLGEGFAVEYFDGTNWNTVATYLRPDFKNKRFINGNIDISSDDYNFPANAAFRYRSLANINSDRVYIDQIIITGTTTAIPSNATSNEIAQPITSLNTFRLNNEDETISMYPNPAKSTLEILSLEDSLGDIHIFNMYGVLVETIEKVDKKATINVSKLASAPYFIRFVKGDRIITKQFIKE